MEPELVNKFKGKRDILDNSNKVKKPPVQKNIKCNKCGEFSGYTNDDLMKMPTTQDHRLKCQSCNEVVITILKQGTININDIHAGEPGHHQPI